MVCYFPMTGYRSRFRTVNGKYGFTFDRSRGFIDKPLTIPCGKCVGCKLDRAKMWAVRCLHEASLHERNCFITLTYDSNNLPENGSLVHSDFQLFMKRFRKRFGSGIRFFMCGEYGDKFSRPHFHACIFNFDFSDRELWSVREGVNLYRSSSLESLWTKGFSTVGDVNVKSASYVARYCMKKVHGRDAIDHYQTGFDSETGEVFLRKPEYTAMSRRPGIGRDWIVKYSGDVFPDDFIVLSGGHKMKTPRYYDFIYDTILDGDIDKIKALRKNKADLRKEDNSSQRLRVRHECQNLKLKKLVRSFENDK